MGEASGAAAGQRPTCVVPERKSFRNFFGAYSDLGEGMRCDTRRTIFSRERRRDLGGSGIRDAICSSSAAAALISKCRGKREREGSWGGRPDYWRGNERTKTAAARNSQRRCSERAKFAMIIWSAPFVRTFMV